MREMDFLKTMLIGGWVLDTKSADVLSEALPNTHIKSIYGMTEMFCIAVTEESAGQPRKIVRSEIEGIKQFNK